MLNENKGTSETGGVIVLVTDGKNSPGYLHISDVQEDIIKAKIRVITIAFGCESILSSFVKSIAFSNTSN
jgi:calcium-activated chloride channel regulator 4